VANRELVGEPAEEVEPAAGRGEHQRAARQVGRPQLVTAGEHVPGAEDRVERLKPHEPVRQASPGELPAAVHPAEADVDLAAAKRGRHGGQVALGPKLDLKFWRVRQRRAHGPHRLEQMAPDADPQRAARAGHRRRGSVGRREQPPRRL